MTYAFDCDDYNLNGLLRTSIRLIEKTKYPDLRNSADKLRFRRIQDRRLAAKRWLTTLKRTKAPKPRLQLVG
jgi:hypothetical protein